MALYNLTIPAATGQLSMEQRQMINYISVSYTHLDVYKRQLHTVRHAGIQRRFGSGSGETVISRMLSSPKLPPVCTKSLLRSRCV